MTQKTLLLASIAVFSVSGTATAEVIDLGKIDEAVAPSCPAKPCLAVSRTTGFQIKSGGPRDVMTAQKDGRVVAWSIKLGKPGEKQTTFFNQKLGGESSAHISILRPVRTGEKYKYVVTGESPIIKLEKYFGTTVQFPLKETLNVKKGYLVALSVPSWAPALAVGLDNKNSWRASRVKDKCDDTQTQTAQDLTGTTEYRCFYRTARLTYSALMVTTP